jgi:RHS repeat-associated protein
LPVAVLTKVQKYQNTNTVASPVYKLLSTDTYCYNGMGCGNSFSYPITQKDVYHYVDTTSLLMSHSTQVFDSYGNTTSSSTHDYIIPTGQTLTTTTTFSGCGQGSTILDHPCDVLTTDGAHNLSETKYTYNPNGAPLSSSRWTGSTWLTTNYTPNATGTIGIIQEPNGQTTNIGWDATGTNGGCNGMLPTWTSTVVNGVTLKTWQTWDCNTGLVLTATDANGNTPPATQYDSMLRPSLVADNLGFSVSTRYTSNSVTLTPSLGTPSTEYVDGLSRPIIGQHQQSPTSSDYDTISSSYAFSGPNRRVSVSSPCTQTSDNPCGSNFSTSTINPIGLPISSADPVGGTLTYAYNQNDASVTVGPAPSGEHVKTVQTETDGFGRIKSVCALQTPPTGTSCGQVMGGSGVLNTYSYSFGAGQSTVSVTRGSQTHTTITDASGRVEQVTTPESGTVTYYYDSTSDLCGAGSWTSNGDLIKTVYSSGKCVEYRYDTLHRVTDSCTSPNSYCKRFRYDNSTGVLGTIPSGITVSNNLGRVVEAETDTGAWPITQSSIITDEWFSYDKDGRLTDMWESTPHSGGYYHTSVTYNPNGTISALNGIPGYTGYTFGVDGEGRPSTASQASTTFISGVQYDPASRPLFALIAGSGDNDGFTYNAKEKMTQYAFTVNGTTEYGTLTWNMNGTLQKLVVSDGFNSGGSQTCNFSYDDVARLVTDNCGSVWSQTFSYDQYDNLNKPDWNFSYNQSNNQMQGGPTYDADGRVTYDTINSYSWDAYGKMIGVRAGTTSPVCGAGGTYCATYDAMGRIVETSNGSTYKEILYGPTGRLAQMSGQSTVEADIPLPGGLTLKANGASGGTQTILHNDWLGTNRLATSFGSRTWSYDTAYTPYGETYDTFGTPKQDFTGDFQDIAAGLFDTPNRELAANASRWLSPDPAGASWNAYSYPTNPNSETDRSGAIMSTAELDKNGDGWLYDSENFFEGRVQFSGGLFRRPDLSRGCAGRYGCGALAGIAAESDMSLTAPPLSTSNLFSQIGGGMLTSLSPQTDVSIICGGDSDCHSGFGLAIGRIEMAAPEPEQLSFGFMKQDRFLSVDPMKTYQLADHPSFRDTGAFGRSIGGVSWKLPGSPMLDPEKAPMGGWSAYQEGLGGLGEWRAADHWMIGRDGSFTLDATPEQMRALGGTYYPSHDIWLFDHPVAGWFPYTSYP